MTGFPGKVSVSLDGLRRHLRPLTLAAALSALTSVLVVSVLMLAGGTAQALDVPPAPKDIPVVDQTATLTEDQKKMLADHIAAERMATGNQIAILMIKTLDGNPIEDYSIKVARGWGIGQKGRNSGVLFLIVKDDHQMRIEVGTGLEGALPDIRAGQIIRDRVAPQFRQGKYYEGINEGLSGIITAIHGEADPNLKADDKGAGIKGLLDGDLGGVIFWTLLLIPVWLGSILARTKSWWAGGVIGGLAGVAVGIFFGFLMTGIVAIVILTVLGLLFDKFVSANYRQRAGRGDTPSWWAGGPWIGGGGGGGSGFGGFGGGNFGGGGASGSW